MVDSKDSRVKRIVESENRVVAGAIFGEVAVSFFCGRSNTWWSCTFIVRGSAVFGEVAVSLLAAGAILGEVALKLHIHVSWQGQYLVKLQCYFWWQAQYLYFSIQNARDQREKWPQLLGGLPTDGFMVGSCSDHSPIMVGSAAHCKWRFSRFLSYSGVALFVAGTILGEVAFILRSFGGRGKLRWSRSCTVIFRGTRSTWWSCSGVQLLLFVAGAVFGEIWNDSRSTKCCIFHRKCEWPAQKVTSVVGQVAAWRVHGRIMFGSFSDHGRIGRAL